MKDISKNTSIKPLSLADSTLSKSDWSLLKKLNTPIKIQDFINRLPFNFEENEETYMSVERALKSKTSHCFEGALIAAASLWVQGHKPLLMDINANPEEDDDHVVVLFSQRGFWGAISKTNHAMLRYRDPVYKNVRELAMSYFNEYFLEDGQKTMLSYSKPYDLAKLFNRKKDSINWLSEENELFDLVDELENSPHIPVADSFQRKNLRKVDPIMIKTIDITEYDTPKWYYNL